MFFVPFFIILPVSIISGKARAIFLRRKENGREKRPPEQARHRSRAEFSFPQAGSCSQVENLAASPHERQEETPHRTDYLVSLRLPEGLRLNPCIPKSTSAVESKASRDP